MSITLNTTPEEKTRAWHRRENTIEHLISAWDALGRVAGEGELSPALARAKASIRTRLRELEAEQAAERQR